MYHFANIIIEAGDVTFESDLNQDGSLDVLDIIILANFIIEYK